ncbi:FAD-dependent oxidoreductase [Desnuesiella massiliensis]|uniref:FAD-dependent oxidoreductase n=1 Tax=Desnuesiella massiliensis TaxID=1650662 RepID=UPI0006E14FE2|nr:FAD-dependent oxidoreductase [Desnuesiella massiliensis]
MNSTFRGDNLQGIFRSYWIESTKDTNYPKLEENIEVDIAIIGGGITGITLGYLLKKEGAKIAILEANKIAKGTTGHTTAKITSQHHLIYDKLINQFGIERALQYAEANEYAINFIEETINEHNIQCDFHRLPAYMYTEDINYIVKIEKEIEAANKLGLNAKYLSELPLPFSTQAAVAFENQAEFHPRKYLLPLAEKIPGEGSYIFENTPVVEIENENSFSLITANKKRVKATKVVIASHFPCYDALGLYFTRLKPDRSYVIATNIKEEFPQGMFINAEEPGRSLRPQVHEDRQIVLVGGEGHKTGHGGSTLQHYINLKNFAESTFNVNSFLYLWSTQDYITLDLVPYVGYITSSTENMYVATGYGKWGMTNGTAAAILLKDLIIKKESPWQEVYNPSRNTTGKAIKSFFVENTDVAVELIKGKLEKGEETLKLNLGEGKEVKIDGKKYGAYKDNEGNTHIVDITCTHLGCELKWNDAEKSWDCPCHGSRFSYDGEVLEGPAHKKLNHYKEEPNRPDPNIV